MRKRRVTAAELSRNFPQDITSEFLHRQFMILAKDRYPSADKVLQNINIIAGRADLRDPIKIVKFKILLIAAFRDSVRQVATDRVFTSIQHRDDLFKAIIEASEALEEELVELEEGAYGEDLEDELSEEIE